VAEQEEVSEPTDVDEPEATASASPSVKASSDGFPAALEELRTWRVPYADLVRNLTRSA
jgi:hypothetical protein